jgi:hypothetical protein
MSSDDPTVQAHIAAANTAEASGNHTARAASATAALQAWKASMTPTPPAQPQNSVEAGQRLDFLTKDASFRNAVMAGDSAVKREFDALTAQVAAGDPAELAIQGVRPAASVDENSGSIVSEHDLPAGVNHLREVGYTDMHVHEILTGRLLGDNGEPLTEAQIAERVVAAERMQERLGRDAEWRRKYLSGDRDAAALMGAITATLAAGRRS